MKWEGLKGYRNFCNKIWNAARFIKGYPVGNKKFESTNKSDHWIYEEFEKSKKQIERNIKDYRLDYAVNEVYDFFSGVSFATSILKNVKKNRETHNLRPLFKRNNYYDAPFCSIHHEEIHSILFDSSIIQQSLG